MRIDSLKKKVRFFLILTGLLPLLLILICAWKSLSLVVRRTELAHLDNLADAARVAVEKHLEFRLKDIRLLSRNPVLVDGRASIEQKLEELRKCEENYGIFDDITLIDRDGDVITSVHYRYRGEWGSKQCFREALRGKAAISRAMIIPDPVKVIMIFAAPVFDRSGRIVSVVAGQMLLGEVWNFTDNLGVGETGSLAVIDEYGNFIAAPDKEGLFMPSGFHYPEPGVSLPGTGRSLVGYAGLRSGPDSPLPDWRFAAVLPEREAFLPLRIMFLIIGIAGLFSVFLVFGGSKLFSRSVLVPIERLIRGTGRIMGGDLGYRLPPEPEKEIAELRGAFNRMTDWFARALRGEQSARAEVESVFHAQTDMILTVSPGGTVITANRSAFERLGRRETRLIGQDVSSIFPEEERGRLEAFLKECAIGTRLKDLEMPVVTAGGRRMEVLINGSPVPGEKGPAEKIVLALRDITERRVMEEKLRSLGEMVNSASVGIVSTDRDNRIVTINPAGERMLGYSAREIIGREVSIIESDKTPEHAIRTMTEQAARKRSWDAEVFRRRKDGEDIPVWISVSYVLDERGKKKGAFTVMRDLTEIKRLEQALIYADRMAAVGTMATGIAHEIRNPLAGMEFGLEALGTSVRADPKNAGIIENLHEEILGLNEMVVRLLEYGRRKKIELGAVEIEAVMEKTFFFLDKQLRDGKIRLRWEPEQGLRPVRANPVSLQQVFMNILINAVQAMEEGGEIKVSAANRGDKDREEVEVVFSDNGCGIDETDLARIFEAFFTSREEGTGMGLAISKKIIEEFGGRIEIESRKGQGTTVRIILAAAGECLLSAVT